MEFRISDTFTDSLAKLSGEDLPRVREFSAVVVMACFADVRN